MVTGGSPPQVHAEGVSTHTLSGYATVTSRFLTRRSGTKILTRARCGPLSFLDTVKEQKKKGWFLSIAWKTSQGVFSSHGGSRVQVMSPNFGMGKIQLRKHRSESKIYPSVHACTRQRRKMSHFCRGGGGSGSRIQCSLHPMQQV